LPSPSWLLSVLMFTGATVGAVLRDFLLEVQ
jgi:hypothetical protein